MDRHDEEKKQVVLTADDFKNAEEFFTHFKIEMPEAIAQRIAAYKQDPASFSFEDQKKFRAYIAHSMITIDHPLVKDEVFKNIRAKCEAVWYESQFDMDLEKILSEPKK